jgi:nitrous oxidase accessory protein NosD
MPGGMGAAEGGIQMNHFMRYFIPFLFTKIIFSHVVLCEIINIPADYSTIQEGINAASSGDSILVAGGTYPECLKINKSVFLCGSTFDTTFVTTNNDCTAIRISANDVQVRNFRITNSGAEKSGCGIELVSTDSCHIDRCEISNFSRGINLISAQGNIISRCRIENNTTGIFFAEPSYDDYVNNERNEINNNIINKNTGSAIEFAHTLSSYHMANRFAGNCIRENGAGISTIMCQSNTFSANDLYDNAGYGIALTMCTGGGENNYVYRNNFINNNAGLVQACDFGGAKNYWYSIDSVEGNFWSDYHGVDSDSNGIGDTPYIIEPESGRDIYPLIKPLRAEIHGIIHNESGQSLENVNVEFMVCSISKQSDADGKFTFSWIAGFTDVHVTHPGYQDKFIPGIPLTPGEIYNLHCTLSQATSILSSDQPHVSSELKLRSNYPNPFNSETLIEYYIPKFSQVNIEIYSINGQLIRKLIDESQNSGTYFVTWNGKNFKGNTVSSGVYLYMIRSCASVKTKKLVFLK